MAKNKDFLAAAHKAINTTTEYYTITDYMLDMVKDFETQLDAHQVRTNAIREEMDYLKDEWANCLLRQYLHLY